MRAVRGTSLLFVLLLFLFLWPLLSGETTLSFGDIHSYFYPMKHLLAERVRSGEIPQWNRWERLGIPFLANPQTGFFYPPSLILYLFPFPLAFNLFVAFLLLLHFSGAYRFLRVLGFHPESGMFGALLFAFGGMSLSWVHVLNNLQTAAWLPWVGVCWVRWMREGRPRFALFAIPPLCCAFLGGEPLLFAGMVGLLLVIVSISTGGGQMPPWRERIFRGVGMIGGIGLSLLIVAVQLFPTAALAEISTRAGGVRLALATEWSFAPRFLLSLFVPNFAFDPVAMASWPEVFGHPRVTWLASYYLGVLFLPFLTLGLKGGGRGQKLLLGVALFAFLLALGKYTPLYPFCHRFIPGFDHFRFPERYLAFTLWPLILVAARGFESWLRDGDLASITPGGIVGMGAALLAVLAFAASFVVSDLSIPLAFARHLRWGLRIVSLFSGMGSFVLFAAGMGRLGKRAAATLLLLIAGTDLAVANLPLNPPAPASLYRHPPHFSAFLPPGARLQDAGAWGVQDPRIWERLGALSRLRLLSEAFFPDIGTLYHVQVADGSNVLVPEPHLRLLENLRHPNHAYRRALWNAIGVTHLTAPAPLSAPGLSLRGVLRGWSLYLYENHEALARASIVPEACVAEEREGVGLILRGRIDLRRVLILPPDDAGEGGAVRCTLRGPGDLPTRRTSAIPGHAAIRFLRDDPEWIVLEAALPASGYLLLLDSWAPGWRVWVDGVARPLLRANVLFRGVRLEGGAHRIVFRYETPGLRRGGFVSLLGVALTFLFGCLLSRHVAPGRGGGRRAYAWIKRGIDLVGALFLLLLTLPLTLLLMLLIPLESRGGPFFRQCRVGREGRPFTLWKFRTMRPGSEPTPEEIWQPLSPDDPRITRLGRWLRCTGLDELPQLWNVLLGEMSLVGPRPALPEQVAAYTPEEGERLRVKPGITGLAQIEGRDRIPWERRIEIDRAYVARASLTLDLTILWKTIGFLLGEIHRTATSRRADREESAGGEPNSPEIGDEGGSHESGKEGKLVSRGFRW
ncbi:MAG: hypothetical protein D6812_11645 [Deltaproteobacteria bacterium]|nr:MAG: hypothetical protein D6812_11645 [Deltaproteobacteria bacterium]